MMKDIDAMSEDELDAIAERDDTGGDPDLTAFNARFAVVKIGGKTRVMEMESSPIYKGCKVPIFSSIHDFCAFHAKQKKSIIVGDKEREVGVGKWWIDHPERRQYDCIAYAPNEADHPNMLNLWTGFACEAVENDCSLYLEHLHENICSGNREHSTYLLNWMTYAVQQPGKPGEVAVVLRGKEGVGKGVLVKWFGKLFGPHFRQIVQAKHLTGHFNSHLQQCSVLYADESFFAGDRSHESVLKALITEETLMIEPKGVDPFFARNCIHLLMSSNNDWVVPAGADARRYFVLNVSDTRMQQSDYFAAISDQMEAGGLQGLLHLLMHRDLSGFNVRQVPQTDALAEQKAYSRRGIDRLVEKIAHEGVVPCAEATMPNTAITSGEEKGEGFYCAAKTLVPDLKYDSSTTIKTRLCKEWGCDDWKSGYRRGIKFPPLEELRARFDDRHGRQEWPEVEDWGGA